MVFCGILTAQMDQGSVECQIQIYTYIDCSSIKGLKLKAMKSKRYMSETGC